MTWLQKHENVTKIFMNSLVENILCLIISSIFSISDLGVNKGRQMKSIYKNL